MYQMLTAKLTIYLRVSSACDEWPLAAIDAVSVSEWKDGHAQGEEANININSCQVDLSEVSGRTIIFSQWGK